MKTLVIHPIDSSTDFLSEIYKNKDWTIIRALPSKSEIKRKIKEHDRIVMLGHGSYEGLYNPNMKGIVIDSSMVQFLREKQCVGIWCYADEFFRKYKIPYACSGMIISDYDEACLNCVYCNQSDIDESNEKLAKSISDCIDEDNFISLTIEKYKKDSNPVINFNIKNLFQWQDGEYI